MTLVIIFLLVYFIPTIIAFERKKVNRWAIFWLNFFLGFTILGWIVPFVWAVTQDKK